MAKTAANRFTMIVINNASGIVAKIYVLTTLLVLHHAVLLANQHANPHESQRRNLHLHLLRLDQVFALVLLITRATRPGNPSAAATTEVVTVQATIPCATTIPRDTQDGTIVHISQITIAIPMVVAHLAAS